MPHHCAQQQQRGRTGPAKEPGGDRGCGAGGERVEPGKGDEKNIGDRLHLASIIAADHISHTALPPPEQNHCLPDLLATLTRQATTLPVVFLCPLGITQVFKTLRP